MSARTLRVAIYVRISLDQQGKGEGVERQEQRCREYCAARPGWNVVEVYCDNDVSASSKKPRPEWERLLRDVREGRIDAIVVWAIDRLTRKPRELEDVIDLADEFGLALGTVTGEVDLSTPFGRACARIMGVIARQEAEAKGQRQREQRLQAASKGRPNPSGPRPYGYNDDRVTLRLDEAALVRDAARRVLGGETLRSICEEWNAAGITTSTGKRWHGSALTQILKSARISGRREVGTKTAKQRVGEIVAVDCWEKIISPVDSDRLRRLLTDESRLSNKSGSTTVRHLLSGVLTCGRCGNKLSALSREQRNVSIYRCVVGGAGSIPSCGRLSVARKYVEPEIIAWVVDALDTPSVIDGLRDRVEVDPAIAQQVRRDEQELIDIARDKSDGLITRGEWLAQRETVQARLDMNRKMLARVTNTDALLLLDGEGTMREQFERLNLMQQRALVSMVLESVRVEPNKPENNGRAFDVERLQPVWRV